MARQPAAFGDSRFGASGRTKLHGSHDPTRGKKSYDVELKDVSVRKFAQTGESGMKEMKKKYKDFL